MRKIISGLLCVIMLVCSLNSVVFASNSDFSLTSQIKTVKFKELLINDNNGASGHPILEETVYVCDGPMTLTVNKSFDYLFCESTEKRLRSDFKTSCGLREVQSALKIGEFNTWQFTRKDVYEKINGLELTISKPGLYVFTGYTTKGKEYSDKYSLEKSGSSYQKIYVYVLSVDAKPTESSVIVDGEKIDLEAYNIDDNNYFKLRDIAKVVSGSSKQFNVVWDSKNKYIDLKSKTPYDVVGGELEITELKAEKARLTPSPLYVDGKLKEIKSYEIHENNFYKLRDLGSLFNFDVSWDGKNIIIETSKSYTND